MRTLATIAFYVLFPVHAVLTVLAAGTQSLITKLYAARY